MILVSSGPGWIQPLALETFTYHGEHRVISCTEFHIRLVREAICDSCFSGPGYCPPSFENNSAYAHRAAYAHPTLANNTVFETAASIYMHDPQEGQL